MLHSEATVDAHGVPGYPPQHWTANLPSTRNPQRDARRLPLAPSNSVRPRAGLVIERTQP